MPDETPQPAPRPLSEAAMEFDESVRAKLLGGLMAGFFFIVALLVVGMVKFGWEISPTANNLVIIIVTSLLNYIGMGISYYFGTSSGSSMKSVLMAQKESK